MDANSPHLRGLLLQMRPREPLPPAPTLEQLLSVAVNMDAGSGSRPIDNILGTAAPGAGSPLSCSKIGVTQQEVQRLIGTALLRGVDPGTVLRLRAELPASPHLTKQWLKSLMPSVLVRHEKISQLLKTLQGLPEVKSLSVEDVGQLLLAGGDPSVSAMPCLESFCKALPAFRLRGLLAQRQQVKQQMWDLLLAASGKRYYNLLQLLLGFEAARQLNPTQLITLLQRVPMAVGGKPGGCAEGNGQGSVLSTPIERPVAARGGGWHRGGQGVGGLDGGGHRGGQGVGGLDGGGHWGGQGVGELDGGGHRGGQGGG